MGVEQLQVTLIDSCGTDLSIVNAARCSFGKTSEWANALECLWGDKPIMKDQDVRLLKYLAKHKHMSPFGHVFLSFHIKAPIFVHAQLLKHKFLRANTISRRYVDSDIEFYQPDVWRGRSEDKKQGSDGVVDITRYYGGDGKDGTGDPYLEACEDALEAYGYLLAKGTAPEMARMVLPQSLMTEWYWSGSLDAFADMCRLRIQEDSQYESRVIANQVYQLMKGVFPVAAPLLVNSVLAD